MTGIAVALRRLADDEGREVALRTAERWHAVLEEMREVGNADQQASISFLIGPVKMAIELLVIRP